ncbi:hypothetical protein BOTBODRAFT_33861 [Botryobasidium botryosum FD-172 SS1]|uniref:Uncharacterized protein n=1 Tax=Botryobasidium botryosum (strain FD-172 SS1) TaxID=930990 RepID=A0A067MBY0_BOTB1|nr:hypothetical protein BOTBODRAFT_33861 [Botryobasidium botryosum FD-172 SS1]
MDKHSPSTAERSAEIPASLVGDGTAPMRQPQQENVEESAAQGRHNNRSISLLSMVVGAPERLAAAKIWVDSAFRSARARHPFSLKEVPERDRNAFDALFHETMRTVDELVKMLHLIYCVIPVTRRRSLSALIFRICILQKQQQVMEAEPDFEYFTSLEELEDTRHLVDQQIGHFRQHVRTVARYWEQVQAQG